MEFAVTLAKSSVSGSELSVLPKFDLTKRLVKSIFGATVAASPNVCENMDERVFFWITMKDQGDVQSARIYLLAVYQPECRREVLYPNWMNGSLLEDDVWMHVMIKKHQVDVRINRSKCLIRIGGAECRVLAAVDDIQGLIIVLSNNHGRNFWVNEGDTGPQLPTQLEGISRRVLLRWMRQESAICRIPLNNVRHYSDLALRILLKWLRWRNGRSDVEDSTLVIATAKQTVANECSLVDQTDLVASNADHEKTLTLDSSDEDIENASVVDEPIAVSVLLAAKNTKRAKISDSPDVPCQSPRTCSSRSAMDEREATSAVCDIVSLTSERFIALHSDCRSSNDNNPSTQKAKELNKAVHPMYKKPVLWATECGTRSEKTGVDKDPEAETAVSLDLDDKGSLEAAGAVSNVHSNAVNFECFGATLKDSYREATVHSPSGNQAVELSCTDSPCVLFDSNLSKRQLFSCDHQPSAFSHSNASSSDRFQSVSGISTSLVFTDTTQTPQTVASRSFPQSSGSTRRLRPVIIDGLNVGYHYGHTDRRFNARGVLIAVDHFLKMGHDVKAVLPKNVTGREVINRSVLKQLDRMGLIDWSPSRVPINEHGQRETRITSHDDSFIVKAAFEKKAVILSNDQYRDIAVCYPQWSETIRKRLLQYWFSGEFLLLPSDPNGPSGDSLETFLSFGADDVPAVIGNNEDLLAEVESLMIQKGGQRRGRPHARNPENEAWRLAAYGSNDIIDLS
jgi:hypothetical protein